MSSPSCPLRRCCGWPGEGRGGGKLTSGLAPGLPGWRVGGYRRDPGLTPAPEPLAPGGAPIPQHYLL